MANTRIPSIGMILKPRARCWSKPVLLKKAQTQSCGYQMSANMSADKSTQTLDRIVALAQRKRDARLSDYRAKALKMYPWICGRCCREFERENLRELTVHHRDHNHDNNPSDGSNWELLCLYCHDNEHQRQLEAHMGNTSRSEARRVGKECRSRWSPDNYNNK